MVRSIFASLLSMAALLPPEAQAPSRAEGLPSVSISLPANIPSETVQISYFLVGPFGGHRAAGWSALLRDFRISGGQSGN
jgi:hypothetical protein